LGDLGQSRVQRLSQRIFLPLFVASFSASTYALTTTSISMVPREFPFAIVKLMPLGFWVATVLSLVLLVVAMAARVPEYLWAPAVLLVILVAAVGDIVYAYPRAVFSTTATQWISQTGTFHTVDEPLLCFPGSVMIFSFIAVLTDMSSTLVVKLFGVAYNLIVLLLSCASFRRLGVSPRSALLASLVTVFSFYLQGALIYTSLLGFLFYILIFGFALAPCSNKARNTLLVVVFFGSMVVSHAFSPFLTLGAMSLWLFGWRYANLAATKLKLATLGGDPPRLAHSTIIALVVVLVAYWSYFAVLPLYWGLSIVKTRDLLTLILGAMSPIVSPQTIYARTYASIVEAYPLALFSAFSIYLITVSDRRKLQLLLWILGLAIPLFAAVSGYVQEFTTRIFAFAILPLSYGIARLFDSDHRVWRVVGLAVLLITLSLHLPAHYGQDSFQVIQDSEIKGLQSLGAHTSPDASLKSPLRELYQRYYVDIYRSQWDSTPRPGSYFVMNYKAGSWVLYTEGDESLASLIERQNSNQYARIYSSGSFDIYWQDLR